MELAEKLILLTVLMEDGRAYFFEMRPIRCHLFTCVVAMTYLRRLELRLSAAGVDRTAEDVMEDMQHLHSVLTLHKGAIRLIRRLETPTKTQSEVLTAFGHRIDNSGVLQPVSA